MSVRQLLAQLQQEHQQRIEELAKIQVELERLTDIPPAAPVDSLDAVMRRAQRVVTRFQEAGLSADFSTAPPITITINTVSLQAIPCHLSLQADSLPRLIRAVQMLERAQVLITYWQLTAQTADVSFHVVGDGTLPSPTVIAAKEKL
jgi:hypothetical protein